MTPRETGKILKALNEILLVEQLHRYIENGVNINDLPEVLYDKFDEIQRQSAIYLTPVESETSEATKMLSEMTKGLQQAKQEKDRNKVINETVSKLRGEFH
jgi:hypothetical protein